MSTIDFKKSLKGIKKEFLEGREIAKTSGGSFGKTELPDGKYLARLSSMEFCLSQSSGRRQVQEVWEIVDGEFEGEKKYAYPGLETSDNIGRMIAKLDHLGYEAPEKPEELLDVFDDVTESKPVCKITLKTNGDFQNVYLDAVVEGETEDEDEDEDEVEDVEENEVEEEDDDEDVEEEEETEEDDDEESEEESDEDEEEDEVDLDEMSRAELKKLIADQELDIKITKKMSDDDVRKAIGLAVTGEEEEEDEEEEEEVPEEPKAKKKKAVKRKR